MSNEGTQPPSITPRRPALARSDRPSDGHQGDGNPAARVAEERGGPAQAGPAQTAPGARFEPGGPGRSETGGFSRPGESSRSGSATLTRPEPASLPRAAPASLPREDTRSSRPRPTQETAERPGPATSTAGSESVPGAPRRVRLALARIDPWSVMKLSFLVSVGIGIMIVVAAAVVWFTLDGLNVFTQVNSTISEIAGDPEFFDVLEYMAFDRVVSLATMIAVVDIVLLTALSTISAFLYNIVASLVGGVHVTLTDD